MHQTGWELARPLGRIYTADGCQKKAGSPGSARRSRDAALTATREDVSRVRGHPSPGVDPHEAQEHIMSPHKRDAKHHAKARRRRYRTAHERLARDRRQAQHAAEALQQALDDVGLPVDLVTEIAGRLRSQQKLLGKIVGMMCPPLFGCRTNFELCRVRGWDKNWLCRKLPKTGKFSLASH